MIKKEILVKCVNNNLLHDIIYKKLKYRQKSIDQSFRRSIDKGYLSVKIADPKVIKIVKSHFKLTNKQLLEL